MRSGYALYVVAIICFILGAVVFAGSADYAGYLEMDMKISMVTTAVLVILGLIFAGAGYLIKPEEIMLEPAPRPPAPKPVPKISAPPPTPMSERTITPPIEITEVKGIGPKRAEQLKDLGIHTAQDLAETEASALASKTELSPKTTHKWVREAKRLTKEAS